MRRRDLERRLLRSVWRMIRRGRRPDVWGRDEYEIALPRHGEINEHTASAIFRPAERERA